MTSSAKKTPAKKTPAKKTPAKKTPAKKTPAKKTPAKKTPAKSRSTTSARPRREHDLVVFGATGFTGRLVAAYLARHAPANMSIALAGRNESKLARIRDDIGGRAHRFALVVANCDDSTSLAAMAASTRALITTVGPYAKYGLPVVAACAQAGTNYCDLTGEVLFMRDSIDQFDTEARSNKARIVHSCGFDSIPSDLGVLALSQAIAADDPKARMQQTRLIVTAAKGGISGGTIASGLNELDRSRHDARAAELLADPYALSPDRPNEPSAGDSDPRGAIRDDIVGTWAAPFLMGPINSRVVRRSNALSDYAYGAEFRYAEYLATGDGVGGRLSAAAMALGMAAGEAALSVSPVRALAEKVLPEPGSGPSDATRARGHFRILLHTRATTGVPYRAEVAAKGDPGYAATAMMLATTGVTLAGDGLPHTYGVLTPATGLGGLLITNLKLAGMTLQASRV
jgi:short subunit dehydrogenase-like uncharacterized protein